jgi:hypothetical protein
MNTSNPTVTPSWIQDGHGDDELTDLALVDCFNHLFGQMVGTLKVLQVVDTSNDMAMMGIKGLAYSLLGMAEEGRQLINQWHEAKEAQA